jgi:hypothetical protein
MRKRVYFDIFDGPGWPSPGQLQRYFLADPGQRWMFDSCNDCWGLSAEGIDGTEHLPAHKGRIDIRLTMLGNPDHGVLLHYQKSGRDYREAYYSREDLRRLREWIETMHGDLMPIGLYVPFERAWAAVKEFMEMDGALPKSIAWIGEDDIPDDAFPDPYLHRLSQR